MVDMPITAIRTPGEQWPWFIIPFGYCHGLYFRLMAKPVESRQPSLKALQDSARYARSVGLVGVLFLVLSFGLAYTGYQFNNQSQSVLNDLRKSNKDIAHEPLEVQLSTLQENYQAGLQNIDTINLAKLVNDVNYSVLACALICFIATGIVLGRAARPVDSDDLDTVYQNLGETLERVTGTAMDIVAAARAKEADVAAMEQRADQLHALIGVSETQAQAITNIATTSATKNNRWMFRLTIAGAIFGLISILLTILLR
jgi:hypothetical protein